jgi:alkylation response protein AidB-like acyl-CoA dehydrogenase
MRRVRTPHLDAVEIEAELRRRLEGWQPPAATLLGAGSDDNEPAHEFLRRLADGGWMTPRWPVEYGGLGLDGEAARTVEQAVSSLPPPDLYAFMVGLALVGPTLLQHGTADQCARWLPAIRSGAEIWCQLFSEPDAGSDLAGLACRAERRGDEWRVTGSKVWSSRASYADLGFLLARFDFSLPKHEGIVALAIDMHAPGVDIQPLKQMNGDAHFSQVFLDDVAVEDSCRIDEIGAGWAVAKTTLAFERSVLGQSAPGGGDDLRSRILERARRRGKTADPGFRDRFMRVWCDMEAARLTIRRARALASAGDPAAAIAGAGGKIRLADNLKALSNVALAVEGAGGMLVEQPSIDLFLTAPSVSIRGGTDEIQRNTIGERILGLPTEPRLDRGPFAEIARNPGRGGPS